MKIRNIIATISFLLLVFFCFWMIDQVYLPKSNSSAETIFTIAKGESEAIIAKNLEEKGIIKSAFFFRAYAFVSGDHAKLQAGTYSISPALAAATIVKKFAAGDVIRQ